MKSFNLAVAALFAVGVIAYAADKPALTVSGVFDMQLKSIEGEIISLAEAMPADKFDFAPTGGEFKGVRTFGEQLKHVAATNYGMGASVLGEKIPVDVGKDEKGPDSIKSKEQIVAFLKDSFTYCHKAMATVTKDNLTDSVGFAGGSESKYPRGFWANLPIWHSYDHYGQIVVYARMNGVVPPASRK